MNRVRIREFLPANPEARKLLNRMATNLLFLCRDKKTIAVSSCHDCEGKTTLAVQLAYTLAQEGYKIIVVDAVSEESAPIKYLRTEHDEDAGKDFPDCATGKCDLSSMCFSTEVSNLRFFPLKSLLSDRSALPNPKLISGLIDSLADSCDFIIVDTPSAGHMIDATMIAGACDGIVLVVEYRRTKKKDIREIVYQLEKSGTPILGCIINKVKFDCIASRKRYRFLRTPLSKGKSL